MALLKKAVFVVILIFVFSSAVYAVDTSASCAVLMEAQSGEVIYQKNEHEKRSMASTTKIMTSLIALENADLKREFKVSGDMLKVEGTSMGLLDGDLVSFEDLVYGMLLQSGNDAANVTAVKLGGSVEDFAQIMNERAKQIGMENTNFVTPSGLDDENHYSTAYDMALLACEAIKNADFRKICSTSSARISYGNPPYMRTLTNHNKLLDSCDGCFGIKTGFTKKSGRCLVSACERNGVTLVCVTLNDPDDWYDHKSLYEYGFSKVSSKYVETSSYSIPVAGGTADHVRCVMSFTPSLAVGDLSSVRSKVFIKSRIFAPVKKGDTVGRVVFYRDKKELVSVSLVCENDVETRKTKPENVTQKESIKEKIKKFFILEKGDKID